jgi:hypothetical protein
MRKAAMNVTDGGADPASCVDDVLITSELTHRPSRPATSAATSLRRRERPDRAIAGARHATRKGPATARPTTRRKPLNASPAGREDRIVDRVEPIEKADEAPGKVTMDGPGGLIVRAEADSFEVEDQASPGRGVDVEVSISGEPLGSFAYTVSENGRGALLDHLDGTTRRPSPRPSGAIVEPASCGARGCERGSSR